MDKVFINSSKIECKDNSGNITFSSNFNYLKTNSASKTEISGIALTRVPQGISQQNQGSVSSAQVGNINFLSATSNNVRFYFSNFHSITVRGFILNRVILPQYQTTTSLPGNNALIQQLVSGSWVTRLSSPVTFFSSAFAPQGSVQAYNQHFFVPIWNDVTNINSIISTHGGGNYRLFINSTWNSGTSYTGSNELSIPVYQQSGGAKLINAEITS
jgi:hypothetical protein